MDLVERERYLEALEGWLREAAAGQGRLVLVGGEAGIGKTALVDHFSRVARGRARVLHGACDALSTPQPLGPLHDIAGAAGGELDRLLSHGASRDRIFRAALAELSAGLTPTLAIVEDAHWADEATLDLLRFLGRRLEPVRALLIVTFRDDEVGPVHPLRLVMGYLATTRTIRRLDLEPLSEAGIRVLAVGSELDPASLHHLTGGNPFFASEVLAARTVTGGAIPATVRDAVLARASRISPAGREVLDAAAVIGSPVGSDLLIRVARTTSAAIEACLSGGMLIAIDDEYAFRHELVREAIYDAISPPRRRDLHAAVLAALRAVPESVQDVAHLAHHAEAAGDRQAVLRYAPAAARSAAILGANREATAQYARAVRFADGLPASERLSLLEAYADVSDLAGSGVAAVHTREEMIALARLSGDRHKEAEHLGWLADSFAVDGRYAEAERAADAALAVLADLPEGPAQAEAYCHQAHLRMLIGDVAGALTWGERAIDLATRLSDARSLVFGLNVVGEARFTGGDEERGRTDLERSAQIAREARLSGFVAAALANLGSGHAEVYRFERAERYLTEAIAYASEREEDNWRHWSVAWLAQTRLFQGRWTEATDLAGSILRDPAGAISSASPHPSPVSIPSGIPDYVRIVALLAIGRIRARRGDPEADDALAEAQGIAGTDGIFRRVAPIRAVRAEQAWLAGDRAKAVAEARAALDQTTGHRQGWLEGELAIWLWRAGDAVAPSPGIAAPYRCQIEGDWAAAATAWDALGCPYEAALALLEGDEAAVRQARDTFARLGARPAEAIAARRLRTIGARGIPRGPRAATRSNPAGLTARELEILPLLAAGRRTTDIATVLFLSPKTVEHHIGSILAKLDVHARSEVAAAAGRLGLPLAIDQNRGLGAAN